MIITTDLFYYVFSTSWFLLPIHTKSVMCGKKAIIVVGGKCKNKTDEKQAGAEHGQALVR